MAIVLSAAKVPAYLKCGFFGGTGSGKTWTAAKMLAQFIRDYLPGKRLAMYDTEPGAGFIAPMVKEILGTELLVIHSRAFSDLLEFVKLCETEQHVGLIDSITHPWRQLCGDYLNAKRSRVASASGRTETVRLTLQDWGPLKDMWAKFSEPFAFGPAHLCICGREGDVWDEETNDEGEKKQVKTGVKMKTETETGYEPSLLVQMRMQGETPVQHRAFVCKDRFNELTGKLSGAEPDIEFFRPHLNRLDLKGKAPAKSEGSAVFHAGSGPNWETIKARREAVLEEIKNDILLSYPGQSAADKTAKVNVMRAAFGTAAWTELESDERKWPIEKLTEGRENLKKELAKNGNA